MAKYAAAVDQGTTSSRFMIFDHSGNVVTYDQREHAQLYPKPGWVEHDPMEIWGVVQSVIAGALAKGAIDPKDISAIGITNQRETALVWNKKTGKPVYNAIVWQDTRTDRICSGASPGRRTRPFARSSRAPARDVFFGSQGEMDPGQCRRCAGCCRRGQPLIRKHGCVVDLESDGRHERRRACYRCDQCIEDDVDESRYAGLGRRDSEIDGRSAFDAADNSFVVRKVRHSQLERTRRDSDCRHSGRPTSRAVWTDLFRGG